MNKSIVLYLLLAGLLTCFSCTHTKQQPEEEGVDSEWLDSLQHVYQYGVCIDSLDVAEYKMRNGDNPAAIFSALGFSALKADSITKASIHVLNPTKLRAGMNYYTFTTQDSVADIRYIAFAKSLVDYAVIDLTGDSILAYEFNKPITIKRHYTEGTINSSLWNVIKASGADPLLAIKISDVYAWQIDFFDVKEGDSFRVLYDVAYIDDTTALNITSIEGAVFTHQGKDFTAIPFTQDSVFEYFDLEGNSLRKAFLKAPLDFFRITSRFTNARFPPILKRYRAHHGVDYAAPVGTEVKSIGAGTGIAKGYIADQMKAYLNQKGITSGYINLGGNVLALGAKTDGSAYTIGIQRPFGEENEAIASVSITDQTVVSSGVYERYFEVDGTRYHHILDTATGYPYDNGLLEVTIITGASVDGDGLSTTCFSLGLEDGMALVESLDATEAIFITDDYEVHTSSGMGTVIPYEILED